VSHPLTSEFWYKNGGILRKCKTVYTLKEKRYRATQKPRPTATLHSRLLTYIRDAATQLGIQCNLEVAFDNRYRIDAVFPDLRIAIELKNKKQEVTKAKRQVGRIKRAFPEYAVYVIAPENGDFTVESFIDFIGKTKLELDKIHHEVRSY